MNINKYMRYQVHDEVGLLRAFVYEDEAKKFATLVAEYLQSNTLTSNLGGY